jgi:hypothetical protein
VNKKEDLLANMEKLIKSPAAYKLSESQYDDLKRLQEDAQALCEKGDLNGAHQVIVEIHEIVEEGAIEKE